MRGPDKDDEEDNDIPYTELMLEYTMKNAKGEELECLLECNDGRQMYFNIELISNFFGIPMDALIWQVSRLE